MLINTFALFIFSKEQNIHSYFAKNILFCNTLLIIPFSDAKPVIKTITISKLASPNCLLANSHVRTINLIDLCVYVFLFVLTHVRPCVHLWRPDRRPTHLSQLLLHLFCDKTSFKLDFSFEYPKYINTNEKKKTQNIAKLGLRKTKSVIAYPSYQHL